MPTECRPDLFGFAPVEGREVVAAFDAGAITSDARALLLGATDRAIGTAKLYLPPGGRLFGRREAYGLTCTCCQLSGSPLIASIAADFGTSPARVRTVLRELGFFGGRPHTGAPVRYAQAVGRTVPG
jgi:hypothetical protein